jgi:hypothetical protein
MQLGNVHADMMIYINHLPDERPLMLRFPGGDVVELAYQNGRIPGDWATPINVSRNFVDVWTVYYRTPGNDPETGGTILSVPTFAFSIPLVVLRTMWTARHPDDLLVHFILEVVG